MIVITEMRFKSDKQRTNFYGASTDSLEYEFNVVEENIENDIFLKEYVESIERVEIED